LSEIKSGYHDDTMKRFSTSRRIPFTQLFLVTVLGVVGGVYIWKPVFESFAVRRYEKAISATDQAEGRQ
jgi:hypothetical protein